MDNRYQMTRREYAIERAALVADALAIRSGCYGAKGAMYLYGNRMAVVRIRGVYYARRNKANRAAN